MADITVIQDIDNFMVATTKSAALTAIGAVNKTGDTISGSLIIDVSTNTPALRVTQRGTGTGLNSQAILVEDDANPDSTPFVVTRDGNVGIGVQNPLKKLSVTGDASLTGSLTCYDTTALYSITAPILKSQSYIEFIDGSTQSTAAKSPVSQIITTTGTWTKPIGASIVNIQLFAGGGGGGSGRKDSSTTVVHCGGGGGGGGSYLNVTVPATALLAAESVTIGAGGIGGAAQTSSGNNGNNGSNGTSTEFGSFIATGGGGGVGGSITLGTGGSSALNSNAGGSAATNGGSGGVGLPISSASSWMFGGPGGGAGGGISNINAAFQGGAGGRSNAINYSGGLGGAAGGISGDNGTSNTEAVYGLMISGSGGGGGGGNTSGAGGQGGNGGFPAAGGGGGGAAGATGNSGNGGSGANGMAIITTYF